MAILAKHIVKKYLNIESLIHSIKTVIACWIGIFITKMIGAHSGPWIVITIIVVMCAQIYVGSVINKAWVRFLGTLIDCLFAATTLWIAGPTDLSIVIAISLSSFIFSFLATKTETLMYAATLGAVTTAIIMLGQDPSIRYASERFFEIGLGILIAALVSQFILPINARSHLRSAQAASLAQLRDYYAAILQSESSGKILDQVELEEAIVKSLMKQRQLARESIPERLGTLFDPVHFLQSLHCERDILRAISFMHQAKTHVSHANDILNDSSAAHTFNESILRALDTLTKAIESDNSKIEPIYIPNLSNLNELLGKKEDVSSRETLLYTDGFLFCAEILTTNLAKLANLYRVPIQET